MSIVYNGVLYTDKNILISAITNLSEYQQQCVLNDFDGVPNEPVTNPVPFSVTNNQLRQAMVDYSYDHSMPQIHPEQVTTALRSMPASKIRDAAIQSWEYSNEMIRANPMIAQMSALLGLTDSIIDELFIVAKNKL